MAYNSILGSDCFTLGQTQLADDTPCAGGGPTEYNNTATGGIVFGGNGVQQTVYNNVSSGGIVFGGSGSQSVETSNTASGGILFGGEGLEETGNVASGGIVFGGEGVQQTEYNHLASGGIVFGGEGVQQTEYNHLASGGIVFGGAATQGVDSTEIGSGGIVFGGEAIEDVEGVTTYNDTATGGIVFGGEGVQQTEYNHLASGGIVFGGEAVQGVDSAEAASGGIVFGGEGVQQTEYNHLASGGIVFGGEGVQQTEYNHLASGGIVFGGEALESVSGGDTYNDTATGGIVFGGSAVESTTTPADLGCCQQTYNDTATGGIVFGGSATETSTGHRATGGIRFGGSAIVSSNLTYHGYEAVYHLDEQGNGTAGEFEDSANDYDAQGGGGFDIRTPTRTAGLFSAANEFDGNEFIECPEFGIADTDPLTISLWAKRDNQFLRRTFYSIGKTDVLTPEGWQIRIGHTEVGKPTAAVQVEAGDDWAIYTATGDDVLTDDCWHHLAAVWEPGVGLSLYVDGELVDFTEVEETSLVPATSGSYIGRVDNTQYAQAKLQEVRIAPLVREAEWLLADHEAICDTEFYSVGEIMTPVYNLGE